MDLLLSKFLTDCSDERRGNRAINAENRERRNNNHDDAWRDKSLPDFSVPSKDTPKSTTLVTSSSNFSGVICYKHAGMNESFLFLTSISFFFVIVHQTIGKGGKNRRRGKGDGEESKRELEFKEDGQEYSQVVRMLGNGRCECFCFDGVTRLGHIRGKMRKKVWITAGDIVLVAKRDFQDEKVDIVHKYTADEARNLKQYGELPENARINETAVDMAMGNDGEDDDDLGISFDDI